MELMTRCPACGTTFSASLEQLQLRKGYVRCVGCAHIFDGYEAVVPGGALVEPHVSEPGIHVDNDADDDGGFPPIAGHRDEQAARAPEPFLGAAAPPPDDARTAYVGEHAEPAYADEPSFKAQTAAYADDDDGVSVYGESRAAARPAIPDFLAGDKPARHSIAARLAWLVLILAGVLLALAQAAYVYRMQLAVQWPSLRPLLETACQRLDCEIPYARSMAHLSITDSSLQRQADADSQDGRRMLFEALLRNSLDAPQQWPVMWLELTDVSGAVLSRRYLPPDVYLAPNSGGPAIAAASERRISVPLQVESEHVSGYQVGLFFP